VVWPLAVCAALVGAGFVGGRAMRPAAPPLVIERSAFKSPPPLAQTPATGNKESVATNKSNAPAYGADGTATERPTEADEVVSMCGARTKKGTPCSRRVRGTGRCWQHRGKSAMLSAAKLLVQD